LRIVVYLSVLLLLFMGIAQAAHHHGSWTEAAKIHASSEVPNFTANDSSDSDPACMLCMVSHSALPSFPARHGHLDSSTRFVSFLVRIIEPRGFWSYSLFSRPPPQA
jgi:hypothetical protein